MSQRSQFLEALKGTGDAFENLRQRPIALEHAIFKEIGHGGLRPTPKDENEPT